MAFSPSLGVADHDIPWTMVLTGRLVGAETVEGQDTNRFFMAGECSEGSDRRSFRCAFNSVAISSTKVKCLLSASAWVEEFTLVKRSDAEIVWAATKGPEGTPGAMATSTLRVLPSPLLEGRKLLNPRPGSVDRWEYTSRITFSNPRTPLNPQPVTTRAASPGSPGTPYYSKAAQCLPDEIWVDARQ